MRVEPAEPAPQDRGEHVEQHARCEDGVIRGDSDGAAWNGERGDRAHARVVGSVQMHDVDVQALEQPAQLQDEAGRHGVDRLRGIAVERDADTHAHDLEALVDDRPGVRIGDRRRVQQMPGDDGHLVTAPG